VEKDSVLKNEVCLRFCPYYKEGKKEDLSCRGYAVVERFLQQGRLVSIPASCSKCDPAGIELIVQRLCMYCDFHEDGCDFFQDRTARPCGGFALLAGLIADGALKAGDL